MLANKCLTSDEQAAIETQQIELESLGAAANNRAFLAIRITACITTYSWMSGDGRAVISRGSMAIHIDNVKDSNIRQVDKLEFLRATGMGRSDFLQWPRSDQQGYRGNHAFAIFTCPDGLVTRGRNAVVDVGIDVPPRCTRGKVIRLCGCL